MSTRPRGRGRPLRAASADVLARNLRRAREQAGLSLEALGALAGVSGDMLGNYEAGANSPSAHKLHDIAQALRVSMDALFSLDFPKKSGK